MIFLDSRYAEGTIFKAHHATKGTYELSVFRKFPVKVSEFYYYEVLENQRIEEIAGELMGGPEYWHSIMDFNPEILNPEEITPGTLLRIPYAD